MADMKPGDTTAHFRIAAAVRDAAARAAAQAYEEAGLSGLCAEGRWECAIEAVRHLDLDGVLRDLLHRP